MAGADVLRLHGWRGGGGGYTISFGAIYYFAKKKKKKKNSESHKEKIWTSRTCDVQLTALFTLRLPSFDCGSTIPVERKISIGLEWENGSQDALQRPFWPAGAW